MLNWVMQPKWRNGRRAGLKIRSSQEGVGSSPTFGTPSATLFALGGLLAGVIFGGVCTALEYLVRGRNLHDVALTTDLLVYPLVGLGVCWFGYRNTHMPSVTSGSGCGP